LYNGQIARMTIMNAPDKLLKIPLAAGVYILRPAPSGARAARRRAASALLTVMRQNKQTHAGKSNRAYLKEARAPRHGR
jgi:hypothetical protein